MRAYAYGRVALLIVGLSEISRLCAQDLTGDAALRVAVESWERSEHWDGPNKTALRWTLNPGELKNERILDGEFYLRHYAKIADGEVIPLVAIRNPKYAAYVEKKAENWVLRDIAYNGDDVFRRYSHEAEAPWVAPLRLPGKGAIADLIKDKLLVLKNFQTLSTEPFVYRFGFEQNVQEASKRLSLVEVDASPEFGWFPQRLHWVSLRSGYQCTLTASGLKKCGDYFVPTRLETLDERGADWKIVQELTIDGAMHLETKECFLEYYGLGELKLPKKKTVAIDWLLVSAAVLSLVIGIAIWLKVKGRRVS